MEQKVYPNGDVYLGQLLNGEPHGQGTMKYADKSVYDGEWEEDLKHGTGTMTYSFGKNYGKDVKDVYNGEFQNDEMHGIGTMTYSNGDVYVGEWVHDAPTEKGILKNKNGDIILKRTELDASSGQKYASGSDLMEEYKLSPGESVADPGSGSDPMQQLKLSPGESVADPGSGSDLMEEYKLSPGESVVDPGSGSDPMQQLKLSPGESVADPGSGSDLMQQLKLPISPQAEPMRAELKEERPELKEERPELKGDSDERMKNVCISHVNQEDEEYNDTGDLIFSRFKYDENVSYDSFVRIREELRKLIDGKFSRTEPPDLSQIGFFKIRYSLQYDNIYVYHLAKPLNFIKRMKDRMLTPKEFITLYGDTADEDTYVKEFREAIDIQIHSSLYEYFLIRKSKSETISGDFEYYIQIDFFFDRYHESPLCGWHTDTLSASDFRSTQLGERDLTDIPIAKYVSLRYILSSEKHVIGTYVAERYGEKMTDMCVIPMTVAVKNGTSLMFSNLKLTHSTPPIRPPPSLMVATTSPRVSTTRTDYENDSDNQDMRKLKIIQFYESYIEQKPSYSMPELRELVKNTGDQLIKRSFARISHLTVVRGCSETRINYAPKYYSPSGEGLLTGMLDAFDALYSPEKTNVLNFPPDIAINDIVKICTTLEIDDPHQKTYNPFLGGTHKGECMTCPTLLSIITDPDQNLRIYVSPDDTGKGVRMRLQPGRRRRRTRRRPLRRTRRRTRRRPQRKTRRRTRRTKGRKSKRRR